jgi:hypothetical protein
MDCIECGTTNPDGNLFCGRCGAELGLSVLETVKKGLRDRQAIEMEITESVVARLMKWTGWLGSITAILVVLVLGGSYLNVRKVVNTGKSEIVAAVQQGKTEIDVARQTITGLKEQVTELQSDVNRYKQVNSEIGKLQSQLMKVQGQVLDLGKRDLKANTVTTTAPGPGYFGIGELGCPSSTKGFKLLFCAQGSPPSLFQLSSTGQLTPVSSLSPVGFADVSTGAKPTCNVSKRGTFFVEKGSGRVSDKPFLCARESDNTYNWIPLAAVP